MKVRKAVKGLPGPLPGRAGSREPYAFAVAGFSGAGCAGCSLVGLGSPSRSLGGNKESAATMIIASAPATAARSSSGSTRSSRRGFRRGDDSGENAS